MTDYTYAARATIHARYTRPNKNPHVHKTHLEERRIGLPVGPHLRDRHVARVRLCEPLDILGQGARALQPWGRSVGIGIGVCWGWARVCVSITVNRSTPATSY